VALRTYLREGDIVDGSWEVIKQIGQGGSGTVYLVRDIELNRLLALKEVPVRNTDQGKRQAKAVVAEVSLLKSLSHPSIPRILKMTHDEHSILIIMDYIEGYSLRSLIAKKNYIEEALIVKWGLALCDTLKYLHNRNPKVIYRDLKPHNVMLSNENHLFLMDFGISREVGPDFDYSKEDRVGTKGYAAPEMRAKNAWFDERSDIYALGRTLYFLATRNSPSLEKLPNGQELPILPIRQYDASRSVGLEKIIEKATAYKPTDRYQSVEEMIYDLKNIDKMSEGYIRKIKRRATTIYSLFGTLILGLFLLGSGALYSQMATTDAYNQAISKGKTSQDLDSLVSASKIMPGEVEPYLEMVKIYRSNGHFTSEDEFQLLSALQSNLPSLKGKEGAGDLLYQVGQLYWFYYPQNGQTKSVSWFEQAKDFGVSEKNQHLLSIYLELGTFKKGILSSITDHSDSGMYKTYWNALNDLSTEMGDDSQLQLTYLQSVFDVIDSYSGGLKSDGLSLDELKVVFDKAVDLLNSYSGKTDAQMKAKTELQSRVETVRNKLNTTYGIR
jgi:hypothetical protein